MEVVAVMPLAIPMIAGPGAITTTIVLMNEAIAITPGRNRDSVCLYRDFHRHHYFMMRNSDYIMKKIGQR